MKIPPCSLLQVLDFFSSEFDLTARQTTALMGAHSLGKAQTANSGFNGVWTAGEANFFNNRYYQVTSIYIYLILHISIQQSRSQDFFRGDANFIAWIYFLVNAICVPLLLRFWQQFLPW